MTWKEFKDEVEKQGVTDDTDIWFIDVSLPSDIDVTPQDMTDEHPNHSLGIAVS